MQEREMGGSIVIDKDKNKEEVSKDARGKDNKDI